MITFQPELLAGLSPDAVGRVLALGERRSLPSGTVLFDIGDEADRLYLIEQGQLALTLPMTVRDQEQNVLIEERGPAQAVGWSALIPPHRFTLRAAATMEAELLGLPRAALLDLFDHHPALGYVVSRNVAAIVGQRLQVVQAMWLREIQRVVRLSAV